MTTGYDVGGILNVQSLTADPHGPVLQPCQGCGQALPNHLSICPHLPQEPSPLLPSSAIPEQTIEQVNDMEKKLGEAV